MNFDEWKTIRELADGAKLGSYRKENYEWEKEPRRFPTVLMVLTVLTWHGADAYLEIPRGAWNARSADLAVRKNFRSLAVIPDEWKPRVVTALIEASGKLKRRELEEFLDLFNGQADEFLKACLNRSPDMVRFLNPHNREKFRMDAPKRKKTVYSRTIPKEEAGPKMDWENTFSYGFEYDESLSSPDEATAQMFLLLPAEEQTKERLDALLREPGDLPHDFIKRLSVPNRNAAYYGKRGNLELAAFWKKKIIPYLNGDVCRQIADLHPEASIKTPPYLTKDGVLRFWRRKKETASRQEMNDYFLLFPKEFLDASMGEDMELTREAMEHAGDLFVGTEAARRFFNRHPADILRFPAYQTAPRILAPGVPLNARMIHMVADSELRGKIAFALKIGIPKACLPHPEEAETKLPKIKP